MDISSTITETLKKSAMYVSGLPVFLSFFSSTKFCSGSLQSKHYINILVNLTYVVTMECPSVTIPWNHQSWASPSKCNVATLMASVSAIWLSWKYMSSFSTQDFAELFDEPSNVGK